MRIRTQDGKVEDVTTGVARRLIQAGEATAVVEVEHGDDDKPRIGKGSAKRSQADRGADHPGR